MTLSDNSLTISRDGLAEMCWQRCVGKQTAMAETVSKKLTDLPNAAVSKTDLQRNYNAVSTPCLMRCHVCGIVGGLSSGNATRKTRSKNICHGTHGSIYLVIDVICE